MPNPRQLILDVKLDNSIALENFIHCASTTLTLNALENFLLDNYHAYVFDLPAEENMYF